MTYCMPVSIEPPKLWALSLYKGTLTKDWLLSSETNDNTKTAILQLMTQDQHCLVKILGKQSGNDINKADICSKHGWEWVNESKCQRILPKCALYLKLQVVQSSVMDAGDHVVVLCKVIETGKWNNGKKELEWRREGNLDVNAIDGISDNAMYSGWLRNEGIL